MAIERMAMMNIIVPKASIFDLLSELILQRRVEWVDARKMIDETSFLLSAKVENAEKIREFNDVKAFRVQENIDADKERIAELEEKTGIKAELDLDELNHFRDYFLPSKVMPQLVEESESLFRQIDELEKDLESLKPYQELAASGLDFPVGRLAKMKTMEMTLGWVDHIALERLAQNAGEVPPFYVKLVQEKDRSLLLFIYPREIELESERVIRSLRTELVKLDERYLDSDFGPELEALVRSKNEELKKAREASIAWANSRKSEINRVYSHLLLEDALRKALPYLGESEHYAYLSLWTPRSDIAGITTAVEKYHGLLNILGSKEARVYELAPTSLKNNAFIRPFESLVRMYGTPAYQESDPTTFFGLAYMLLFGIMFGDLGQGLVFLIAGLLLQKKRHPGMGGVLSRIGLASMVTGFIYDSFFGYEGLISSLIPLPIFYRPFENTTSTLLAAVAFGLVLLSLAYLMGIVNKVKIGDLREALLGREGLAGFCFFLSFLLVVAGLVGQPLLPSPLPLILLAFFALLIFFREPLFALLTHSSRLYDDSASDYYVENSFSLIEMLLNVLSNSLSFIRVGAFALNHVGLFLAFHTLASMLNSGAGNILMGVLGNLLILGLEGLIVFIQDLRLMYYELFSKYFVGDGREFKPAGLKEV